MECETILFSDIVLDKSLGGGGGGTVYDAFRKSTNLGTPQYMAPEQVDRRWGSVGPRTDVYGLGALLYTLLLRRPPFPGDKPLEVVSRVVSEQLPPRLADLSPDIPELLDRVCMKCLSKDSRNRIASAREVAVALRTWQLAAAGRSGLPLVSNP